MLKRISVFLILIIGLCFSNVSFINAQENIGLDELKTNVTVYFFWGDGCPHCETQKAYLREWQEKYPIEIKTYEVWYNQDNAQFFQEVARAYGVSASGVPMTFIGERNWVGFQVSMANQMENYIEQCIDEGCVDKYLESLENSNQNGNNQNGNEENNIITIFGKKINLGDMPLVFATFLIAFVDGLNPCSLWVLAFLLGIVALTKDRKKIILIGLTYLIVAGLVYGAFILGMINVFSYVAHLRWIMILVALIAATFGLINVKDFFWYKKGVSLTISDKHKPKLYQRVRNLMKPENNVRTLMIGAAVMALGITLVELPCTAGLPMLWSNLMAAQNIDGLFFMTLFAIYILVYFLIELIIFLTVVFTLKISKFEEKQGRILKLVGGLIMLSLAVILAFDLDVLNNMGSTFMLFSGVIVGSLVIAKVYDQLVGFKEE